MQVLVGDRHKKCLVSKSENLHYIYIYAYNTLKKNRYEYINKGFSVFSVALKPTNTYESLRISYFI
jgi:hypothetical protein